MKNIALSLMLFVLAGCAQTMQGQQVHSVQDYPTEELSAGEIEALSIAINDEYKARATYQKVIEKFGDVRPFTNIIRAENSHISQLEALYGKYGLEVPQDDWYGKVEYYASVAEACSVGVQAEIENAALYDELFAKVDNQDIIVVFTSLRDASQNSHLPAFERCAG